ncbi:MAG: Fe-S cluster assembly protein SufD [Brumimicrobium sp.]
MEVVANNQVLDFVANLKKPTDISQVRQQALNALNGMDFPHRRIEEWKYTRVSKYVKRKYNQQTAEIDAQNIFLEEKMHQLVFVNGYFDKSQSTVIDDDALTIRTIEEVDNNYYSEVMEDIDENVFSVINKAYQTGGVYLHVKADTKVKYPIHIVHLLVGNEVIANVRHFIHIEKGSKAEVLVTFNSKNSENSFTNVVFEGEVEENATLTINKLQSETKDVLHISREFFVQEEGSTFKMNTITTGGELTRNQLDVIVEGKNCYTEMNGAYLGIDKQHIDNHTYVDQMASHCITNELYKGVMNDSSTGVFNGMILVRPDSQKIEAYQSNKNVLLSEKASIYSKPELEIYADDVRCSHGSTIGELDQQALFYLRSRGINKSEAEQLLVSAFIGDVLDKIENDAVRKQVDKIFLENYGWKF